MDKKEVFTFDRNETSSAFEIPEEKRVAVPSTFRFPWDTNETSSAVKIPEEKQVAASVPHPFRFTLAGNETSSSVEISKEEQAIVPSVPPANIKSFSQIASDGNKTSSAVEIPKEEQTIAASVPPAYIKSYSRTRIESTTFDFTWTINEFNFISKNINSLYSSSVSEKFQYIIQMVITRDVNSQLSSIKFYLHTNTESIGSCTTKAYPCEDALEISHSISGRIFDKALLIEISQHNHFRRFRNTLILHCQFDIFHRQVTNIIHMNLSCTTIASEDEKSFEDSAVDELESKSEKSIKFVIGEEQYVISKQKLRATNSSYFKNICLTHDKKEIDMTADLLRNNELEAFKQLLLFITTGLIEQHSYGMLKELLKVAYKYDMQTLKLTCEHYLLRYITIKNAVEFVELAFSCNAKFLKMHLATFIKLHKIEIMTAKKFQDLPQDVINRMMELIEKSEMLECITQNIDSPLTCKQA